MIIIILSCNCLKYETLFSHNQCVIASERKWPINFGRSIIAVHRTVRPAAKSFDLALGEEKNLFMHMSGKFSYVASHVRNSLAHTRDGSHPFNFAVSLFFHLSFSGFFARRCNHLCLPLSIHHPSQSPTWSAHSLLVLIMRHLSFVLISRETARNTEKSSRYFLSWLFITHCQMGCDYTQITFFDLS